MVDHHHHHGKMLLDSYSTFEKGHQFPHYAKDVQGEAVHHSSEVLPGRKIMHPIKESSQEDVLKFSRQEDTGGQKLIMADYFDQRPPPVPPKSGFQKFQSLYHHFVFFCSLEANISFCKNFLLSYLYKVLGMLKTQCFGEDLNI